MSYLKIQRNKAKRAISTIIFQPPWSYFSTFETIVRINLGLRRGKNVVVLYFV